MLPSRNFLQFPFDHPLKTWDLFPHLSLALTPLPLSVGLRQKHIQILKSERVKQEVGRGRQGREGGGREVGRGKIEKEEEGRLEEGKVGKGVGGRLEEGR